MQDMTSYGHTRQQFVVVANNTGPGRRSESALGFSGSLGAQLLDQLLLLKNGVNRFWIPVISVNLFIHAEVCQQPTPSAWSRSKLFWDEKCRTERAAKKSRAKARNSSPLTDITGHMEVQGVPTRHLRCHHGLHQPVAAGCLTQRAAFPKLPNPFTRHLKVVASEDASRARKRQRAGRLRGSNTSEGAELRFVAAKLTPPTLCPPPAAGAFPLHHCRIWPITVASFNWL